MKRKLRIILPMLVLIGIGTLTLRHFLNVEEKNAKTHLNLYGNVDIRTAQLAFFEQERIAQVLVEEGDPVTAGQTLATLQTQRLEAQTDQAQSQADALQEVVNRLEAGTRIQQIDQARAEAAAARTTVANAEQTYQRLQKTSSGGVTSEQDLDNARTQLAVAKSQLEVKTKALNLALEGPRKEDIAEARNQLQAANAGLALLKIRLDDMVLKSPADGVIQNRLLEPGEMAGPTRPVFTLALTDPKWVRAYVPEPDLGRIALGMKALIQSDSFPDQRFEGWIGFISPVAEFTPKSVETTDLRTKLVYEARVFAHDPRNRLRLGMPVTVTVDLAAMPGAPPGQPAAKKDAPPVKE
ncbi:MAG: HlyD family efflux transporter periplasmic adaptor subunit [Desulfobacterales bacterium]|nr:HlyD family efflux transporter periplasmic adaptor subunit [Desulfobacterales bacterium]MBI5896703.1 HlyD family efflux transporter periplasmic adaptor subunit [Desulfobacterales bacterium]